MKVVIDTNIIISGILKNRTPEQVILFIAEQNFLRANKDKKLSKFYYDHLPFGGYIK